MESLTKTQQDNRNIIHAVTSRYINILDPDDLEACGLEGLWRCLGYHKDGKGKKFTSNLWTFTDWECRRALRKMKKSDSTPKLFSIDDIKKGRDIPEDEVNPDAQAIQECMGLLAPQYQELIYQYYFEKRTMEEIGKLHNYSKEAARQKINRALQRLREIYVSRCMA